MTTKFSGRYSLSAAFNGEPDFRTILTNSHGQMISQFGAMDKWITEDFYFSPSQSPIKNYNNQGIFSVRLKIKSVGNLVGFQLNDVTIYYRELDR